ncbi:CBM96 family carbohydrate-binding protein [Cystobacter fuscus]|nr:DNRLRE domain-containing protein [Cystobacter fuscus]
MAALLLSACDPEASLQEPRASTQDAQVLDALASCPEDFVLNGAQCTRVSYTQTLEPVADAYVSSSAPGTNYGSSGELIVDRSFNETFLRFDLSSLPPNVRVKSVKLSATAYTGFAWGGDGSVYTYFVPDDSWAENTVTWNTKPAVSGDALGSWWLWYNDNIGDQVGSNSSSALIPVVQAELSGDRQISLRLNSPGYRTNYRSREYTNASQRPKLQVTYDWVTTLEPVADAYVSSSFPTANYGSSGELIVDRSFNETFLRFDLSSLPASAKATATTLSATAYTGFAQGGDGNVYTYFVPDDSWAENTVTWNTRPAVSGDALGSWWLWYDGTANDQVGSNSSPALLSAVQGELARDRKVSLRLNSPGYRTNYRSREYANANQRPKLQIAYIIPAAVTLTPSADAYVSSSAPDSNYGSSSELIVDRSFNETFLRFDLNGLPSNVRIKSVKLSATAYTGYAWGGDGSVYTYFVSDDAWGENTLTWNTKPAVLGNALGSWWLWYNDNIGDQVGSNSSPDLIPVAQAELSGDHQISFRLNSWGYRTNYRSREYTNANQRPQLELVLE